MGFTASYLLPGPPAEKCKALQARYTPFDGDVPIMRFAQTVIVQVEIKDKVAAAGLTLIAIQWRQLKKMI